MTAQDLRDAPAGSEAEPEAAAGSEPAVLPQPEAPASGSPEVQDGSQAEAGPEVTGADAPEAGSDGTEELPVADDLGDRITLPERARAAARKWVAEAAASAAIGGGPDGLASHLRNPRPAPLRAHVGHLGRARADLFREGNDDRWGAARRAAFHLLVAIPVKALAKAMKVTGKSLAHSGEILDWAADSPYMILPMAVIIAALATVLWLLG
jgi:hypothetical protein